MLRNTWLRRCLGIVASYVVAADLIPSASLILVSCAGYLPYSDRPGPGWQAPHLPAGAELRFFTGFSRLMLPATAIYGLSFAAAGLLLGLCSLPRWGLRVLAVPTACVATGLRMAAVGWLIAISPLGVYTAAGCGALWGLFVFPRLVPRASRPLRAALRLALATVVSAGGTYLLLRPLLPDPGLTNAKIEVIRQSDRGSDLSQLDLGYAGSSISGEVKGQGRYVSVGRMEFTTDGRNQLRALLIIDDARPVPNTFLLPRSGIAVYRQSHQTWKAERTEARKSALSLELSSNASGGIGLEVKGPCCSSMAQSYAPWPGNSGRKGPLQ